MTEEHSPSTKNKVVLFPKTHDYYQIELTRMLETERYGEAISLLRFLLQCDGEDSRIRAEWHALLQWLTSAFPEAERPEDGWQLGAGDPGETSSAEEETERDMLRRQFQEKVHADEQYTERLLASLTEGDMDDRKLLVLEQLAAAEDARVDEALMLLLEERELHPLLQFSILQTLKRRGVEGEIRFMRGQEIIVADVEATPLELASFPSAAIAPAERVNDAASVREPSLAYFAQEMWHQYLKLIYGTELYRTLCEGGKLEANAWAAALHRIVARLLHLEEEEFEVKSIYGITDELRIVYERALRSLTRSLSGE
ncbi:hypothetical protein [Paenibacillus apiarius]|uniref:hypothetical protein n=1 Tax=Paenibacillus apiarius TaxID=46240 RepID=UPI00197D7497|nr:hypothetical protein [Paenibacillus apiarius]MBN3525623.1 hypothetical protein [Paenibacillus apiarius]